LRRAAFCLAWLLVGPAWADGPPGASSCSGCHGAGSTLPAIAGRDAGTMTAELEGFRSGARPATLMNRIVKGFSPAELQAIAAWYAGMK
jgi:cytochrome subunit of sulfide dehydrogenase